MVCNLCCSGADVKQCIKSCSSDGDANKTFIIHQSSRESPTERDQRVSGIAADRDHRPSFLFLLRPTWKMSAHAWERKRGDKGLHSNTQDFA